MLSILIPTYNYNSFPLVFELQKQCVDCDIKFEILCQDDCSNDFLTENNQINSLKYCYFSSNTTNLGRGQNRNYLASKAKFSWLLFLDCDMFPRGSNFIENYLLNVQKNNDTIIFGGILYESKKPQKEQLLRWIYGHNKESVSLENRRKKPNIRALTSNLLVKKELLLQHPFDSTITKYGYEDLSFLMKLEVNNILVTHIENPAFHLNLESSLLFLNKTRTALENLVFLEKSNKISATESKIIAVQQKLENLKLTSITAYIFSKIKSKIESNLLSEKPSLFWFDIYKLGYYCHLKSLGQNFFK
ncbi:glycosyltransferase family 2 protein [Flavobacterium hydrophilum]|uniref:Glycosyl transferase n=1 Tax=Flavobacterium hydrophilum TaxID=2211445 RepID=A0A2V4BWR4_9FLAO|nr:glycosyltransferase [Flavobacterium hydrophilum]PXY43458.1 glycosyl transferase [Flavobacterium hydrophilum]